ncbi:MAG: hypothetical protein IJ877_07790, partial [Candidatus Gastranaerophilales bacterium]|nr:hypothetical protein [Candidatus Gastranaerophilales bacterium]
GGTWREYNLTYGANTGLVPRKIGNQEITYTWNIPINSYWYNDKGSGYVGGTWREYNLTYGANTGLVPATNSVIHIFCRGAGTPFAFCTGQGG